MLNDLIELTRLQAGREQLNVVRFNARTELADLCESLQPLAASQRLFLKFDAQAALVVDGDAVKVRRIAQNLILNALKYTDRGGVHVSCGEVGDGPLPRWFLCVQDTGDGLDGPTPGRRTASAYPSEGVGLSIVKRLCELLDAHLELETQRGQGTTFRIIFPRRYSA
jgi:two-component system CheB/CheR fusion protein